MYFSMYLCNNYFLFCWKKFFFKRLVIANLPTKISNYFLAKKIDHIYANYTCNTNFNLFRTAEKNMGPQYGQLISKNICTTFSKKRQWLFLIGISVQAVWKNCWMCFSCFFLLKSRKIKKYWKLTSIKKMSMKIRIDSLPEDI